ncbi:MAG: hypothetical protein ACI8ZB_003771 [Desulforhopalus sp.]|jgi:hypothetical protein
MAKGKTSSNTSRRSKTSMTTTASSRIQSATAKAGSGGVAKGGFAARAQKAAAKNSSK